MGKGMNGINITCYEKNVVKYSKKCEFKFPKILIVGHRHQHLSVAGDVLHINWTVSCEFTSCFREPCMRRTISFLIPSFPRSLFFIW
jgi:hypothetical protein